MNWVLNAKIWEGSGSFRYKKQNGHINFKIGLMKYVKICFQIPILLLS